MEKKLFLSPYLIVSKGFQVLERSRIKRCQDGSLLIVGFKSKRLIKSCLIVLRVIGEGIGQRLMSAPWRRNKHSKERKRDDVIFHLGMYGILYIQIPIIPCYKVGFFTYHI